MKPIFKRATDHWLVLRRRFARRVLHFLLSENQHPPVLYIPRSPLVNETPQERQARHARRIRQVLAGEIEFPEDIPAGPASGPVPAAPTQKGDQ